MVAKELHTIPKLPMFLGLSTKTMVTLAKELPTVPDRVTTRRRSCAPATCLPCSIEAKVAQLNIPAHPPLIPFVTITPLRSVHSKKVAETKDVQVVVRSRRERVVAHDFANTSFWDSRMTFLVVVLSGKYATHTHLAWVKCGSSRRSPDEDTLHDSNIDHSVSSRVFSVGWRMNHAYSLSKSVESQVV